MQHSKLAEIFNNIQSCDAKTFMELQNKAIEIIKMDKEFMYIINTILLCKKTILPSKILHFLKCIFEELFQKNPDFTNILLNYLISLGASKSSKVRIHSLRLLFLIFSIKKIDLNIQQAQLLTEKIFDKEASVRKEALRICLLYQNHYLNENLKIQYTLKDIIRYDQCVEIRKNAMLEIDINENTINCIVERSIDVNPGIRKAFWNVVFKKLNLIEMESSLRIFLLKSAFEEREFDAKIFFIEEINKLGVDAFLQIFYCEEEAYKEFIVLYLKNTSHSYNLDKFDVVHVNFMNIYYKYIEENFGRDSLNLLEIDQYLDILYAKCLEIEEKMASEEDLVKMEKELEAISKMFKILNFYDIFNEESRKKTLDIIKHLLTKSKIKENVEEAIILTKRICANDTNLFLKNIISRIKKKPLCLCVSEYVMKHIPYSELHEAIIQEIVITNLNESLMILYWAVIQTKEERFIKMLLEFLPNNKAIECVTDLILLGIIDFSRAKEQIDTQVARFNENCMIPAAKLLLANKITDKIYLKNLLIIFYSTKTELIQQYLSLFFYEFIRKEPSIFINVFCDVLESIENNPKTFLDQGLYWISNSNSPFASQKLFFEICIFILNNYDQLRNKKFLFSALEKIKIEAFDKILTKKIIYLLAQIVKKRPRENAQHLLTNFMIIDDSEPLPIEILEELKSKISILSP